MSVLVFADANNGKVVKSAHEAISYASKIDANVSVITYGNVDDSELAALGNYGATSVKINKSVTNMDPSQLTSLVAHAAESCGADTVVFSHDFTGKAVAPRVAARLGAGMVAGAVDYPAADGSVKKATFSGKAFANVSVTSAKKVIAVMPNSVGVVATEGTAEVHNCTHDCGAASVTVKEFKAAGGDGVPLPEAELVVSAGRGLKGPENWGMVEDLATTLGATTACSRPVADIGWRPHHEHVGQTGVAIAPNLYIAIGISGAIQHLAGVNRSKVIVVINTDPEAPFFKAADYGIVGDAFEVVPKLLAAFKTFKANQN